MLNSTSPTFSFFFLGAYLHIGNIRYFYFTLSALTYLVVVTLNVSLIALICVKRSLHEPMYLFLCSLFVNELYGSSSLFPLLLLQILQDVHTVPVSFCFLQIYCLYTYVNVELCSLAVMSYDRYLAICCPLQYNTRMTLRKVLILIAVVWVYSLLKFLITLSLSVGLLLCGNVLNSLYCRNYLIVKLSCSAIKVNNIYGLFAIAITILVPLLPILFSYMRILHVCFSGCAQSRQKAVSTCSPHLVSLLNFSFGCCFEIVQTRFETLNIPSELRMFLSLYIVIMPPLLNPIMYGMQMSKIRNTFKHLCCCNMWTGSRECK